MSCTMFLLDISHHKQTPETLWVQTIKYVVTMEAEFYILLPLHVSWVRKNKFYVV